MNNIRIANAPCSWGALEFDGLPGETIGYTQMLNELRATGYAGTELGDWGYMPTDAVQLKTELQQRGLSMLGAFVPVGLKDENNHATGEAEALRVARLLTAVAKSTEQLPYLILADANGTVPERTLNAGRITDSMELSATEWSTFARGAERIARRVHEETGLQTAFHHHCAGFVETPQEIERLLDLTDPSLLGLVFDTGHYLYGTGELDGQHVLEGLEHFKERILHVHFKDFHPSTALQARAEGWDYFTAVRKGIFCELGKGSVPFPSVKDWLGKRGYDGWIVVEQDVLPGMGSPAESAQRNRTYLEAIGL
ncbi:TIM barrel protein [Ktedonospora formicarum]|uniref:Inosose dehydratase n=1 Tax=Ktedonospora formicarum TaxID=2778364 RepID=A0A8J3I673_9CHLR|nr:TIM barrel protein [Ktedonospora formicarum]GHO46114.1 inosose dehydratase [Ktedonospora formicarum]